MRRSLSPLARFALTTAIIAVALAASRGDGSPSRIACGPDVMGSSFETGRQVVITGKRYIIDDGGAFTGRECFVLPPKREAADVIDAWPDMPGGITVSADTPGPNLALSADTPAPVSSRLGQPHAIGSKTLVLEHGPASARFGKPSPQKPIRVEVTAPSGSRTVYRVGARATNTLLGAEAIEGTEDRAYEVGSAVRLLPETEDAR